MPFPFFARLSRERKKTYVRSDELPAVRIRRPGALPPLGARVVEALAEQDPDAVGRACQRLVNELTRQLGVPPIDVEVRAVRPSADWGELHGLYTPDNYGPRARIEVWMRTAKQQRIVAPRTFLRTLVHEVCHHLDYELFKLQETFHTEGFYRRESALLKQVLGDRYTAPTAPARRERGIGGRIEESAAPARQRLPEPPGASAASEARARAGSAAPARGAGRMVTRDAEQREGARQRRASRGLVAAGRGGARTRARVPASRRASGASRGGSGSRGGTGGGKERGSDRS